jgi:hypothetical protein
VIPKPDANVQLCADYKIGVNEQLVSANYPIRRIDDILNSHSINEACSEHQPRSQVQIIERGREGANSMLHQKSSSMEAGYSYSLPSETG